MQTTDQEMTSQSNELLLKRGCLKIVQTISLLVRDDEEGHVEFSLEKDRFSFSIRFSPSDWRKEHPSLKTTKQGNCLELTFNGWNGPQVHSVYEPNVVARRDGQILSVSVLNQYIGGEPNNDTYRNGTNLVFMQFYMEAE